VARKTHDPLHDELKAVMDGLLERNDDVTARAVARLHSTVKNASGIVRHPERRKILEQYQARQQELRAAIGKVRQSGTSAAAVKLQASAERIRELEENEAARVASHLAMIHAVAEMGGTAKLHQFYKRFAAIRDSLAREGALPKLFAEP
jgi:hypothetical protein